MPTKRRGYCVGLTLFSAALPLMTAPLSSQQDTKVKNHSALEGVLEPRTARNQKSNEACAPGANAVAAEMETNPGMHVAGRR
jgi:hypothetical protein